MKRTIKKGAIVTIEVNGLTVIGEVYSADYWGESDGWYIELVDTNGVYRYWKQGQDGGKLINIEGVE